MKKIISILLAVISLVGVVAFPAYANENADVEPCLNNGNNCLYCFKISSSGMLEVSVKYAGVYGAMTKITITTYIQKKTLGLFWTTVDIGTSNKNGLIPQQM